MSKRYIRAVRVEANTAPESMLIQDTLEAMMSAIGGDFIILPLDDNTDALTRENGMLLNLTPNRKVGDDIIYGAFIVISFSDAGHAASLSETEITKWIEHFSLPEILMPVEADDLNEIVFEVTMMDG